MRHLYLLILVCTPGVLSAQNEFQDRTVEALDLSVSLTEDEAVVADDSFEWGDLSEKPNLNDMDLSMLRAAKLSDFQIFNLHSFIKRNGQLLSFYVLYEIKGWDATAIASVSQIFDLRPKRDVDWDFKTLWARSYHTIATRVATTLPRQQRL